MTEPGQQQGTEQQFGVIAEVEGRQRQLVLLNLPFGRLIDEIIVPYDADEAFFIDGVPVTKKSVRRIKIVALTNRFRLGMRELEIGLTRTSGRDCAMSPTCATGWSSSRTDSPRVLL